MSIRSQTMSSHESRKCESHTSSIISNPHSPNEAKSEPIPTTRVDYSRCTEDRRTSSKRRIATEKSFDIRNESSPRYRKRRRTGAEPLPPKPITEDHYYIAPLTREALHQLNKVQHPSLPDLVSSADSESMADDTIVTKDSKASANAYDSEFEKFLKYRGIFYADNKIVLPSDLMDLEQAIYSPRPGSEPDKAAADILRRQIGQCTNEVATVSSILPKVVPLEEIINTETLSLAQDSSWCRQCIIPGPMKPDLTVPKPDKTIGWADDVFFDYPKAQGYLKPQMLPVTSNRKLAWPLFTVEVKGDKGDLKVASLQNLWNGATLLSNLLSLRRWSKKEDDFYNKIHVMSLELTAESIQLSCYWATAGKNPGEVKYYGMRLETWSVYSTKAYAEAWRCTHNALEWVRNRAYNWIRSDLAILEERLTPKIAPAMPTPRSRTDQSQQHIKRSASTGSSLGRASSLSSGLPSKKPCLSKPLDDGNVPGV